MSLATSDCGNQSRHIEQVYDKHAARLQYYFLRQIGDILEADACVQETICRLFDFMEGRRWEEEEEYIRVYLMRIACAVCIQKLAEKASGRTGTHESRQNRVSPFDRLREDALQAIKERL